MSILQFPKHAVTELLPTSQCFRSGVYMINTSFRVLYK